MTPYTARVEERMKAFYDSLSEKDRRRYAALEAEKLGHGGVEYVSQVLGSDPKTMRRGRDDVSRLPEDEAEGRVRKKGGDASAVLIAPWNWRTTLSRLSAVTSRAIPCGRMWCGPT